MKTKTQKHWFEKFYDFMSNFIFGGKRTVLALIILFISCQNKEMEKETKRYDSLRVLFKKSEVDFYRVMDSTDKYSESIPLDIKNLEKALKWKDSMNFYADRNKMLFNEMYNKKK